MAIIERQLLRRLVEEIEAMGVTDKFNRSFIYNIHFEHAKRYFERFPDDPKKNQPKRKKPAPTTPANAE